LRIDRLGADWLFNRILGYRTLPKTQLQLPILTEWLATECKQLARFGDYVLYEVVGELPSNRAILFPYLKPRPIHPQR
jgi:hypothetical protein